MVSPCLSGSLCAAVWCFTHILRVTWLGLYSTEKILIFLHKKCLMQVILHFVNFLPGVDSAARGQWSSNLGSFVIIDAYNHTTDDSSEFWSGPPHLFCCWEIDPSPFTPVMFIGLFCLTIYTLFFHYGINEEIFF